MWNNLIYFSIAFVLICVSVGNIVTDIKTQYPSSYDNMLLTAGILTIPCCLHRRRETFLLVVAVVMYMVLTLVTALPRTIKLVMDSELVCHRDANNFTFTGGWSIEEQTYTRLCPKLEAVVIVVYCVYLVAIVFALFNALVELRDMLMKPRSCRLVKNDDLEVASSRSFTRLHGEDQPLLEEVILMETAKKPSDTANEVFVVEVAERSTKKGREKLERRKSASVSVSSNGSSVTTSNEQDLASGKEPTRPKKKVTEGKKKSEEWTNSHSKKRPKKKSRARKRTRREKLPKTLDQLIQQGSQEAENSPPSHTVVETPIPLAQNERRDPVEAKPMMKEEAVVTKPKTGGQDQARTPQAVPNSNPISTSTTSTTSTTPTTVVPMQQQPTKVNFYPVPGAPRPSITPLEDQIDSSSALDSLLDPPHVSAGSRSRSFTDPSPSHPSPAPAGTLDPFAEPPQRQVRPVNSVPQLSVFPNQRQPSQELPLVPVYPLIPNHPATPSRPSGTSGQPHPSYPTPLQIHPTPNPSASGAPTASTAPMAPNGQNPMVPVQAAPGPTMTSTPFTPAAPTVGAPPPMNPTPIQNQQR